MRWQRTMVAVWLVSSGALAEEPPPRVAVRYDAHAGCPGREVFVGNLLARTERARLTDDPSGALVFSVRIVERGARSAGTLTVAMQAGAPSVREVEADTCGEVIEALALVAALTVDPDAKTAPLTRDAVVAAASSAVEVEVEGPPETDAAESSDEPPRERPPPPPAEAAPPLLPAPPVTERAPLGPEVGVGAQIEGMTAPFGRWFAALRGFYELGGRGNDVIRPTVGASFVRGTGHVDRTLGSAELTFLAGRLDLCPADLATADWVAVRPCVAFDVGVVEGKGQATNETVALETHDDRFIWASGALLGRADFEPLGPLLLRLEAGLVVPFTSNAGFELHGEAGTDTLVDVPSAGLALGAGLGLRLP